ncbi:MAG: response regulator transcription factor [Rhodobacteraceae bacterium]|nr:response regulator transcription factor [Paracoccaceae bacterium]
MKILIADDHDLVRDTIASYIRSEANFDVSCSANLHEALKEIEEQGPFDLVLLDFDMPGMNGLSGLGKALEANDQKPVGIFSGTAKASIAEAALEAGSAGFLPKTMSARSLLNAVRFMAEGETFAPVSFMANRQEGDHEFDTLLSTREKEVLTGLSKGLANKEIARELDLQEVTIKLHLKTLSIKLNARNRTHAAMIARDAGFI